MTPSLCSVAFHLFLILTSCGTDAKKFTRKNLRFDHGNDKESESYGTVDEHNDGLDDRHAHLVQRNMHEVPVLPGSTVPPYNPMDVFDPGCSLTVCGVCEPVVVYSGLISDTSDDRVWKAVAKPSEDSIDFYHLNDLGEYELHSTVDSPDGQGICFGRDVSIAYDPYNILVSASGYDNASLTNIGKVYHLDLALKNTGRSKERVNHDLMNLPFMEGQQMDASYGTNIGLSPNSHHVAISEPGYNDGEGRILLFAYYGYWHEAAEFRGDVSNGVFGYYMFGTYGLEVNLDVSEITVAAERYGAIHFHRNMTACKEHCFDSHASCEITARGILPFRYEEHVEGHSVFHHEQNHHSHKSSKKHHHDDIDWFQCVCDEGYSSHAVLIGDESPEFCRLPSLYDTPATIYDPTHYINCTTYRGTCPSLAENCDPLPDGIGCEEGYTCDNETRTCRVAQLDETCRTETGKNCEDGHVCDIGSLTCRYPDQHELCLSGVGCLDGYQCGDDGVCRFPVVTEECIPSVPCNGTLFCTDGGLCQAPGFKEDCDPNLWGCHRDLKCDGEYKCKLPVENETCHYDKICDETYMCDNNVTGYWECRKPVEFEPCVQSVGCFGLFQCDGISGICRKPIEKEACSMEMDCNATYLCEMGCNTTYICDNSTDTCRLPGETEACDNIVGCNGTLQCGEDDLCRKPIVGEQCKLGPGPGCLGGIVCAIEERLCRLPHPQEPCNHDASEFPECAPTLTCGMNDTCILPTFNETCDTEFNCEPKFRCSAEKLCRHPIENEFCDEEFSCEFPFVCSNDTGSCRKPRDGETCEELQGCDGTHVCDNSTCRLPGPGEICTIVEGCSHESMKCELSLCTLPDEGETCDAGVGCRSRLVCDSNACRLPITHEMCDSLKEGCADGLKCINSNCTLPREAYERCSPAFGCDNFYACDEASLHCRVPIIDESCNVTCDFGYTCDSNTCRFPNMQGGTGEECNPSIGCDVGYICQGSINRCRKPWLNEDCTLAVGCDNNLACGAQKQCITKKFLGESCNSNAECVGLLSCTSETCSSSSRRRKLYPSSVVFGSGIQPYGNQDGGGGVEVITKDSSIGVKMYGNAWKAFPMDSSVFVNRNTVLKFKFELSRKLEGHAICIDEDNNPDTFSGYERRCIAIAGTQVEDDSGDDVVWDDVLRPTSGQIQSNNQYQVPIGKLFQYQTTNVSYVAFIQDSDKSPEPRGEKDSVFWDVQLVTEQGSIEEVDLSGVFDKQGLLWSEVPTPSDLVVSDYFRPSRRILLTKKSRLSTTDKPSDADIKDEGLWYDEGFHYWGIDNMRYSHDYTQALHFLQIRFRDGLLAHIGKDFNEKKFRTFQLAADENITSVEFKIRDNWDDGPEFATWGTDDNNEYKMDGDGGLCDKNDIVGCGNKDETYLGPTGYILGGIRGFKKDSDQIKSVGCNWVKKEMEPEGTICKEGDRCLHIAYSQNGRFMVISDPNGQVPTIEEEQEKLAWYDSDTVMHVLEDKEGDGNWTYFRTEKIIFNSVKCDETKVFYSMLDPDIFVDIGMTHPPRITCGTYQYGDDESEYDKWKYNNGSAVDISNDGTVFSTHTIPNKDVQARISPDNSMTAIIMDGMVTLNDGQTFKGEHMEFSGDSKRMIIAYDENDQTTACVYEQLENTTFALVGKDCYQASEGGLADFGVAVNNADDSYPTFYLRKSKTSVKAYQIVPTDCPCMLQNSACRYSAFNWTCICAGGFVNVDTGVQKIDDKFDVCIPSILLDSENGGEDDISISMKVENNGVFNISEQNVGDFAELIRLRKPGVDDNDVEVSLKRDQIGFRNTTEYMYITVNSLNPGMAYNLTLVDADGDWLSPDPSMSATTKCSCFPGSEVTGRPSGLQVYQALGFVRFYFIDNSLCESGFSVTRSDTTEEFVLDVSAYGASFAPDYYFTASSACGALISPGSNLQDDLAKSELDVGHSYTYCVRAFADNYYMMDTSGSSSNTKATSSGEACARHRVLWEAALNGRITTTKNTGSLPIDKVRITWKMFKTRETQELASGEVISDEGGRFQIRITSSHESLTNTHENLIHLTFEKETKITNGSISHQFLCNNGQDDCSESGTEIYLKHLNFEEQVQIYDNTAIPFRGTINVAGSRCGVSGVEVCIVDTRGKDAPSGTVVSLANQETENKEFTRYCSKTNNDGEYVITPVIGTIISYATMMHYNHTFSIRGRDSNFWELPMVISSDGIYDGMNFEDTSTGEILVDIFGGKCNIPLGKAKIVMSMKGCDNSLWEKRHDQFTSRQLYSVPAQEIEVYVEELLDSRADDKPLTFIMDNYFYPGNTPLILTKDMREIIIEDTQLETAEGMEQSTLKDLKAEGKDSGVSEEEQKETNHLTNKAASTMHSIRFQYNGILAMDTNILAPETSMNVEACGSAIDKSWLDARKINSFHVMNSADMVKFSVQLNYEILPAYEDLEIEARTCDIVDENTRVMVLSQIGVDDNEGFDAWLEKQPSQIKDLLELCNKPGPCLFPVEHDKSPDSGTLLGGAHVEFTLVTGRPKIAGDHIKTVLIQVLGDDSNKHTAGIFVEGLYDKGPGDSFAVPTHEPLMILRDPPGGLSYAYYENMKTTIRAKGEAKDVVADFDLGMQITSKIEQDVSSCIGLGAAICKNLLDINADKDLVNLGLAVDYTQEESEEYSHTYTTTWSYQTSDDPYTAGPMSDVFVVPNFNVMFQEVTNVVWNDAVCDGETVDRVSFSLDNPRNAPAVTFYTRWHIQYEKLPDLKESREYFIDRIEVISDSLNDSNNLFDCTCCAENDQQCIETFDCLCDASHLEKSKEKAEFLLQGIEGWSTALSMSEEALMDESKESIVDWFQVNKYDRPYEGDMKDHPLASLSPTELLEDAKCLGCIEFDGSLNVPIEMNMCPALVEGTTPKDNIDLTYVKNQIKKEYDASNSGDEIEIARFVVRKAKCSKYPSIIIEYTAVILPVSMVRGEPDLMNTKRIQFSGGGGLYELHLEKEYSDGAELSHGYAISTSGGFRRHLNNADEASETKIDVKGSGVGLEVDFSTAVSLEQSHQWIDGGEDYGGGTSVTVVLGDADVGDEFVVEMFVDKMYGTVMFETIAGKSKCPREDGTLAIEDPSIEFAAFPPQNVMYNENIVFQLKLANVGVGASAFRIFTNHALNTDDLAINFNGGPLIDAIQYDKIEANQEVIATFTISRGPLLYKYNPIDFQLFSACENDANLGDGNMRNPEGYAAFTSVDLWNVMDETTGERFLQFLQPCPRVEWAGKIRREHGFLVNSKSIVPDKVLVTVHNPKFSERSFIESLVATTDCTDCRLEDVRMYYRELGTIQWRTALTDTGVNMDFADPNVADETPYGYISLYWGVGGLKEAYYELMVTSQCDDPGTPDDFNSVSTNVLTGVIDKTPPKQFGLALPLSDYVLVGEPIVITFTEPIHCEQPYTFDLNVIVDGTEQTFSRDLNLFIVCEGRHLEFTIDPTYVDATQLLGKAFTVEVGTDYTLPLDVMGELTDKNNNKLKPNIAFSKEFAKLDLSDTSATFTLTIGSECSESTTANMLSSIESRLKTELISAVDPDRISLSDARCINGDSVVATASITPPTQNRRRGLTSTTPEHNSVLAFYTLQDSIAAQKNKTNGYAIILSKLKIHPGESDKRRLGRNDESSSLRESDSLYMSYQQQEWDVALDKNPAVVASPLTKEGAEKNTDGSQVSTSNEDFLQTIKELKQIVITEHNELTQLRYTVACIGTVVVSIALIVWKKSLD